MLCADIRLGSASGLGEKNLGLMLERGQEIDAAAICDRPDVKDGDP